MRHFCTIGMRGIAVALSSVLAAILLSQCQDRQQEAGPLVPKVKTIQVKAKDLVRTLDKGASVSYFEKAAVSAPLAGSLSAILVHEGDRVRQNQALAKLKTLQLELAVRRATAQEKSALARWKLARAQLKKARKASERRLASLETNRSSVVQARTRFIEAKNQLRAKKEIFELGGISRSEMKNIYAGYVSSLTAYYQAKKKLQDSSIGFRKKDLLEAGITVPGDKVSQRKALQKLDTTSQAHQVQVARAAYRKAKIQRKTASQMLSEATIRSPIDGVVAHRNKEPGEAIEGGKPFLSVVRTDRLLVTTSIPEKELPYIRKGQLAVVTVDAYPDVEFEGRIRRVSPVVDPKTRTFEVGVLVQNDATHSLAPGMFSRLKIRTRSVHNAICIPRSALGAEVDPVRQPVPVSKKRSGAKRKATVFLIRDGHAFRRSITLGDSFGQKVHVLSGLEEGDRLAISNLAMLKDGMPIRTNRENSEKNNYASTSEKSREGSHP